MEGKTTKEMWKLLFTLHVFHSCHSVRENRQPLQKKAYAPDCSRFVFVCDSVFAVWVGFDRRLTTKVLSLIRSLLKTIARVSVSLFLSNIWPLSFWLAVSLSLRSLLSSVTLHYITLSMNQYDCVYVWESVYFFLTDWTLKNSFMHILMTQNCFMTVHFQKCYKVC